MLLLNQLQNGLSTDLSRELLDLCTEDMPTVVDKLSLEGGFPNIKLFQTIISI